MVMLILCLRFLFVIPAQGNDDLKKYARRK